MTYSTPALLLVGSAQSLVLGPCNAENSIEFGTCKVLSDTTGQSDVQELW
jgi:hypothetical protein